MSALNFKKSKNEKVNELIKKLNLENDYKFIEDKLNEHVTVNFIMKSSISCDEWIERYQCNKYWDELQSELFNEYFSGMHIYLDDDEIGNNSIIYCTADKDSVKPIIDVIKIIEKKYCNGHKIAFISSSNFACQSHGTYYADNEGGFSWKDAYGKKGKRKYKYLQGEYIKNLKIGVN